MCKECKEKVEKEVEKTEEVYVLTKEYYELENKGKKIINEIIKFCDKNKRFPKEKEMTIKDGYISRNQIYKYFKCKNFSEVYKYIIPTDNSIKLVKTEIKKPENMICTKCGIEKPFTEEYFIKGKENKYGLKYQCKDCDAQETTKRRYRKMGIIYENIEDITPEQWYDYYITNKKMRQMPEHCYNENNQLKIIKYVFIKKLNCEDKKMVLYNFNRHNFEKYKIDMMIFRLGNKLSALQKCFPEYNFQYEEVFEETYTEENINNIVSEWIKVNNLSVLDILNNSFKKCSKNKEMNKKMIALRASTNFDSISDILVWYFKRNKIIHPNYNHDISIYDFNIKQHNGFWSIKENRINKIKLYCEKYCDESILNVINDTEELKKWINKYFRQEYVIKLIGNYTDYVENLYELLIETYPEIINKNVLFDWEWNIVPKYNDDTLIRMLRELVFYRLNDIIINPVKDIPKYLNKSFIKEMFSKFNKHIDRKRVKNYYEWACLTFPEYKSEWTKEDFGQIVAQDGTEFDSYQEKELYEFIKQNVLFQYIKSIGRNKTGKYTFKLDEEYEYERFCPDFVIEYIYHNNKKNKLIKPIIIEFYGMYAENNENKIFKYYAKKTKVKEQFYKAKEDIYYIGIFPEDIKDNFKGLTEKLSSFFIQKFNININDKFA